MGRNPVYALGIFVFSLLILMASGHAYAADEESLLYVTEDFINHGDFALPDARKFPVVGGYQVGDETYSATGLAQSIIILPFYV